MAAAMEITTCERSDPRSEVKRTDDCFEKTCSSLTLDNVYEIAKLIGCEVEKLIDGYGKDSVLGLVPKIVKVLELLESFASRNQARKLKEEELLVAFETLQVKQQKKRAVRGCEEGNQNTAIRELQQKEDHWRRRCEELQTQVQRLQGDNQELQSSLEGSHAHEDRVQRQEREVMLKLKEVVDKQRDELRAKVQQITTVSKEVEALQEQLERFMKMNGELRHRQSVLQTQLKSTVERKADMEADLKHKDRELESLRTQLDMAGSSPSSHRQTSLLPEDKPEAAQKDPNMPCFTKQEVRDILYERNELKANLFLVQEELNYYQREILNDERCPGFLLDAVRATIRKQRTLIKAKMLGIPADECSSDEEGKGPLFEKSDEVDSSEDKPAESRIRNLFGFLTRSGSSRSPTRSPTHMSSSTSAWEIIGDSDTNGEAEGRASP